MVSHYPDILLLTELIDDIITRINEATQEGCHQIIPLHSLYYIDLTSLPTQIPNLIKENHTPPATPSEYNPRLNYLKAAIILLPQNIWTQIQPLYAEYHTVKHSDISLNNQTCNHLRHICPRLAKLKIFSSIPHNTFPTDHADQIAKAFLTAHHTILRLSDPSTKSVVIQNLPYLTTYPSKYSNIPIPPSGPVLSQFQPSHKKPLYP